MHSLIRLRNAFLKCVFLVVFDVIVRGNMLLLKTDKPTDLPMKLLYDTLFGYILYMSIHLICFLYVYFYKNVHLHQSETVCVFGIYTCAADSPVGRRRVPSSWAVADCWWSKVPPEGRWKAL